MTNTQQCPCDCGGMCVLNADLDAAEAKVEQLKQALHDARLKNGVQAALLEKASHHIPDATKMIRAEPSRLEIAMRFAESAWQNRQISEMRTSDQMRWALARADALIAAAKEAK